MKKFSINLLKIGILLIGLFMLGMTMEVNAAKTQYAATDIEIKKFDTSYGTYEPGVAFKKSDTCKNYDGEIYGDAYIDDFIMYYCSCSTTKASDFDKNSPHTWVKLGDKKNTNGSYSSKDGKLTLWTKDGKCYFKVSKDNNIEHYRIVFIVKGIYFKYGKLTPKEQTVHENIDLYCISTDNADDYAIKPTISLDKKYLELHKDDTAKLTATTNVKNAKVKWSSSNNTVTVDQNGNVKAVSATGSATITATINVDGKDYTAICNVTISLKTPIDSTPEDDKTTTFNFNEGDYLKYDAKTATTWNLRTKGNNLYSTKGSKIKGELAKGDVVKVTSIPEEGMWVGVEVVTGELKGKTGDIFFDNNAAKNFSTTTKPEEKEGIVDDDGGILDVPEYDSTVDLPVLEGIDFGETANSILGIVKMLLGWLTEFLASINWAEVAGTVMDIGGGLMGMISGVISN